MTARPLGFATTVLAVLALVPVVFAGGGINPGSATQSSGIPFTATILLDPHMVAGDGPTVTPTDVTTTAKQASIQLRRSPKKNKDPFITNATFRALPGFSLYAGCVVGPDITGRNIDPVDVTAKRFLYSAANQTTLFSWVPAAVLEYLFGPHGVAPAQFTNDPAITQILDAKCVPDPRNEGPLPDGGDGQASEPGLLLMEVVIELQTPAPAP